MTTTPETTMKIYCSPASLEFLQGFATASEFFGAVDALTEELAMSADDVASQLANTIEKCKLCGLWSSITDNDHVLIEDKWHTACPSCLWNSFARAELHADPEMKNTRFLPNSPAAEKNLSITTVQNEK